MVTDTSELAPGSFIETKYDPENFISNVDEAINNAIKLDITPRTRWPNYLGTRVYRLVQSIISSSN